MAKSNKLKIQSPVQNESPNSVLTLHIISSTWPEARSWPKAN